MIFVSLCIVFLTLATLATATHPNGSKSAQKDPALQRLVNESKTQLRAIVDKVEEMNLINWNIIDTLIDFKDRILANKEFAVDGTFKRKTMIYCDGKEFSNDYLFKLIGVLSRTD